MMPQPLTIAIPERDIDDLRSRLQGTRWVGDLANDDWRYGANEAYLRDFVGWWADSFDWPAAQAAINARPNYRVLIDEIPIHYVHVRGKGPAPMPLILTHGWPWTFWDFDQVIGPLTDPAAHGGAAEDAFDVVVPSLPGFGWSSPLTTAGVNCQRTADLWATLMTEVLGYDRFAAQGGDWGAIVTANLGHAHADKLYGIHESLPGFLDLDYSAIRPSDFGVGEEGWWDQLVAVSRTTASHMAVHTTDPQSLAYGLNDSPVALAAWILERRRAWSDCNGDIESVFSREFLATTLSIYWFTQTIGTSLRFYFENFAVPWRRRHDREPAITAPAAFALFRRDVLQVPRSIAERHANIARWTPMPRGGHFAPSEQPELLVDDVRAFFRGFR